MPPESADENARRSSAPSSYAEVVAHLRSAYDRSAVDRDAGAKETWKQNERRAFFERLRAERKTRLLEVGAGTGQDGLFFKESGLEVVATDLSAEMVARCRAKGLEAHVMDFLGLDFPPASFDAGYALNCLLHVPSVDLAAVLVAIKRVLEPEALLYAGTYGGEDFEGIKPDDWHRPPRFFSIRSDDRLLRSMSAHFEVVDFHVVSEGPARFQSLTLRVPPRSPRLREA